MAYLIAVASGDGKNIDLHFGQAESFDIYKVDDLKVSFVEKRVYIPENEPDVPRESTACCAHAGAKVQLLRDCRGIVAARIGFKVQKQFSQLGISIFDDLNCSVKDALKSISEYFYKSDNHIILTKEIKK